MEDDLEWWEKSSRIERLVEIADAALRRLGKNRIVLIGQSPAWLGETMRMLAVEKGQRASIDNIAFSEGLAMQKDGSVFWRDEQTAEAHSEMYRTVLARHQLSPSDIIEGNSKTVFMDYVASGKKFASFLHLLFEWANETGQSRALAKSIGLGLLQSPIYAHKNIGLRDFHTVIPAAYCVQDDVLDHMSAGEEFGRIVPYYPKNQWPLTPQAVKGVAADEIHDLLQAEVTRFCLQRRPALRRAEPTPALALV